MLKNLWKVFVLITLFCLSVSAMAQTTGDVNGDGMVTIVDALMVAQHYVGLDPQPFSAGGADSDCDGVIGIVDALRIAQHYVGLLTLPSCSSSTPGPTPTPALPTGGSVSCAGYPIWNSAVVYNDPGSLVQYNCKLYRNNGYAYNLNPEENSYNQWTVWTLMGGCNDECRMGEGPWVSCGRWDNWASGEYTVYNNIWGGGAGSQCITAESYNSWRVTANHPNTGGVKSYPNSSKNIDKAVSAISSLVSRFDVAVPAEGSYATTYDIWCDSNAYEIMLWMNQAGAVGPIAGSWNDDGVPVAEAVNVTVGGHTWNVYKGNIGFTVISFVRTTNTNSGTVDVKAILDWIVARGWFGDVTVGKAQFGFEITSSAGGLDFSCNSYSID